MCDRISTAGTSGGRQGRALIAPIDSEQREHVIATTEAFLMRAERIFDRSFECIAVRFDLRGRAAGQYRRTGQGACIRYNPHIFAKYFEDNVAVTVPHEVAHYVTDCVYGLKRIRPHGPEWQALMQAFGADAARTFRYSLEGVPLRSQRRHPYRCGCTTHQLTSRRHNRIRRGESRYLCRHCGEVLVPQG